MKGQKFLKVTSILMIIGGVLAAITGLLALLGISALAAMAGSAEGTGLLYASSALAIVSSIIELIAGSAKGRKLREVGNYHCSAQYCFHGHWPDCRRKLQLYKPGLESDCARPVYLRCNTDEKRITVQTARGSVDGSLWQELYSKDGN